MTAEAEKTTEKFEPSQKQAEILSFYQSRGYDCTKGEACESVGIDPRTFWNWEHADDFSAWWAEEAKRWCNRQMPSVLANLQRSGGERFKKGDRKPDAALLKLALERFDPGYQPKQKTDADVNIKVVIGD